MAGATHGSEGRAGGGAAELPLAGVRVVEVASYVAVPAAAALLADLGAEVVKVERPGGEVYRHGRPRFAGYESDFSENPPFHMDNRGKRSVALDLTRPEARDAVLRLIDRAEIFVTNLLPARRARYGLDADALLARKPSLVVGAINGYGDGPHADRPAFDYAAWWAATGMMDTMRDEGVRPSMQRPAVGDHMAAVSLVAGLLAALRLRDRTGRGRYVEVSLRQAGFFALGNDVANALVTREPARRHDRAAPPNPLWNSYPTADGRWLLLVMIEPDRYWEKTCRAIGRGDLLEDERFADPWARLAHRAELTAELEATFARHTLTEWTPRLEAAGLIWSPAQRVEEAVADPAARAHGAFPEVEHPTAGRFETVGPPFRIAGSPVGPRAAAPALDADGEAVLREAGLSDEEIAKLR